MILPRECSLSRAPFIGAFFSDAAGEDISCFFVRKSLRFDAGFRAAFPGYRGGFHGDCASLFLVAGPLANLGIQVC